MTSLHASPHMASRISIPAPTQLEAEAAELEALSTGLRRHTAAWRSAHDQAVSHMGELLSRMDSILERAERNFR